MKMKSKYKKLAIVLVFCPLISNAQFSATIEVNTLNGDNGFVINGVNSSDFLGGAVSYAGDINGDGTDDLAIGATGADPNGIMSGATYLLLGSVSGFSATVDLSTLVKFNGVQAFDNSGSSVSHINDLNGDGIDDFIIGAYEANTNGVSLTGASYVIFGDTNRFPSSVNLSSLNGLNGFAINGVAQFDLSGYSVASAGDLNGDGKDDIVIGSISGGANFAGGTYVIFAGSGAYAPSMDLSSLNGSNGIVINGENIGDQAGFAVSSAGDFNDDGIDDLIIGATSANKSYIVFGHSNGFTNPLNLADLNGINGFKINGVSATDNTGVSVSNADINADGIDDVIIGADYADANGVDSGAVYVLYGESNASFPSGMNLADLNGNNGFVINGIAASDYIGDSISNAGDLNGDKIDDIIIGATNVDNNGIDAGASYVLFGNRNGFTNFVELSDLNGNNGFKVNGLSPGDQLGSSVSYAGDINHDGLDDIIIGASNDDPIGNDSGAVFIIYGNDTIFVDDFE